MIEKIDHINLTVANLTESVDWYSKVFGFEKLESGHAMGSDYAIIGYDDFMLCMYEEKDRKEAQQMRDSDAHQIYHFGFRVKNLEDWQTTLTKHKIKVNYGGPVEYPRSTSWYVYDPSGHEIEVSYSAKGLWGA